MPFNSTFLQSCFNLKVEVAGLCEGFHEVHHYMHRMVGHMDSIEEGVTYFWGFVDRQEAREERRIPQEEERAIREG